MQCHYCEEPAAYAAASEGVRVGLCEDHFQERIEELAEADALEAIREQVDLDRQD